MKLTALGAVGLLALAGCGSVRVGSSTVTSTSTTTIRDRTFSVRGIALHFTYPGTFSSGPVKRVGRRHEPSRKVTRAAIGTGSSGYDLLLVTRYANIANPVTRRNIGRQKPAYDRVVSGIFGRPMRSRITRVGGLPALVYPNAPTPGVPVSATTRATFVFVARDEYELQCQWTAPERPAITSACNQMLRTLHT